MPAYAIVRVDVHDNAAYDKYKEIASKAVRDAGGRFLVRGGEQHIKEGTTRERIVVVEFPDLERANSFYEGELYQQALAHALPDASTRDYVIVEGA